MLFKKIHIQILLLWIFLVLLGLTGRSYIPIDETRYVTVAWNMWLNGDYLVPYLNGVAYSHKPPLLFWLINLGWSIFGINDSWPRLVPSLFALGSVLLTRQIANRLWPKHTNICNNASLILMGSGLWVLYTTALMFDMLIAFFTALGIWGLLIALQTSAKKGWGLFALAIGGGLLAKGPTILLQLLPVALLAFWWYPAHKFTGKNWYLPLFYAVLGGAAIALMWAIPAGLRGGSVYMHDIFWGQTADRMVDSFAHNRPFWWYAAYMPLLFFPWLFWGVFWQGLRAQITDMGVRFCIAWAVPVFVAFSLISGKQVHYVLPLFPAFALLVARYLNETPPSSQNPNRNRHAVLLISLVGIVAGIVFIILPAYAHTHQNLASWLQNLPPLLGYFIVALSIMIYCLPKTQHPQTVAQLAYFSIAITTVTLFVVMHTAGNAYDIRPISAKLKALESQHIPLAHSGKYPGVFNFIGRLKASPTIVKGNIAQWFTAHPNGRLIEYFDNAAELKNHTVEYMQPYKGDVIVIMTQQQWLATTQ